MRTEIEMGGLACLLALAAGCASQGAGSDEHGSADASSEAPKSASQATAQPAAIEPASASVRVGTYDRPGFITDVQDGRLWVFPEGSEDFATYVEIGEPAKHVTRIGAGPGGMTIKGPDGDVIDAYLVARDGFVTYLVEERIWVFRPGSPEIEAILEVGEPAKHVTQIGVGPGGRTVKAPSADLILAYTCAIDGFETYAADGRVWVFRAGAPELEQFLTDGELTKHVTRIGAGPGGVTLKAPDAETLDLYLTAASD